MAKGLKENNFIAPPKACDKGSFLSYKCLVGKRYGCLEISTGMVKSFSNYLKMMGKKVIFCAFSVLLILINQKEKKKKKRVRKLA